jgi:DNA mismatch repair protein MSH6
MQCMVEDSNDGGDADHSITFLYTLGPGTCPKSFGINVARLASLPAEVLSNAKRVSEEFEGEMTNANQERATASASDYKQKILAAVEGGNWEDLERLWQELKK